MGKEMNENKASRMTAEHSKGGKGTASVQDIEHVGSPGHKISGGVRFKVPMHPDKSVVRGPGG